MKANFNIETQEFCYVYSKYKIEEFKGRKYIVPLGNSKKTAISFKENLDELLVKLLNIGKKVAYNEPVDDTELLDYINNYGLLGFMADFPINKYFILENEVVLRDYNLLDCKDSISIMPLKEYLQYFMPKLSNDGINKLIQKCKHEVTPSTMEKYLTPALNEYLIYSKDYTEPVDMILQYAKALYESLYNLIEKPHNTSNLSIINANNITTNLDKLSSNEITIKINYLKQAIDLAFSIHMSQDTVMLKICKFCNKAFIAKNPKAEYDTPNCKNKANVYKFRSKEA